MVKVGGIYKYHRGTEYEVIAVARDSFTKERVIVYRALDDSAKYGKHPIWTITEDKFNEILNMDNIEHPRFKFVRHKDEK